MKKYLSTVLAVVMLIVTILPINSVSFADDKIISGNLNNNIQYELDYSTGTFTVTAVGKVFCYFYESSLDGSGDSPYLDNNNIDSSKITKLVFSEGITLISNNPFSSFKNVKEITLPKSLKRVLRGTFPSDIKIDTINYGGNLLDWNKVQIDNQDGTNNGLINAKEINFSNKVPAAQGSSVFKDKVTEKKNIKNGTCTLNYYTGVLTVSGKDKVEVGHPDIDLDGLFAIHFIYDDVICYPLINSVIINNGVTKIGKYFLRGYADSVTIPKSVKYIEENNINPDYYNKTIKDIYYGGTIVDWKNIKLGEYNDLSGIKIHYAEKVSAKELKYSLSKTSYTYDGKAHTPTVTVKDKYGRKLKKNTDYTVTVDKVNKKVGKYKMVIKLKGEYQGQKTMYYTIKPKSTSITKLTAGKKKLTAKWKKQVSQTTGYQLQYSTDKSFKKNNKTVTVSKNKITSKTISKLKAKKKYYVRVRTYKTVKVNGKSTKIYSSWSKAKAVTIK
ncbi:MAG: leucine-rich repeat domain-containing protein [Acetobacter sp.]|nr:leucine-rich repeat domain-containing protein [Acetobacter sp.]MCM1434096.1 leucine-rich repeat domain-containing protein [Clostridiales bacterium]